MPSPPAMPTCRQRAAMRLSGRHQLPRAQLLTPTASLNIRNEFVDDIKGQRTGYTRHLSKSTSVGFGYWSAPPSPSVPSQLRTCAAFTTPTQAVSYRISALKQKPDSSSTAPATSLKTGATPSPPNPIRALPTCGRIFIAKFITISRFSRSPALPRSTSPPATA